MKKMFSYVCVVMIGWCLSLDAATSPMNGSANSAVVLPAVSASVPVDSVAKDAGVIGDNSTKEKDAQTELVKPENSLVNDKGEVTVVAVEESESPSKIKSVQDLAQFMRAFKDTEVAQIITTIGGLEKMLDQAERALRDLKKGGDPIPLLVRWAKVKSALDGERQVLAAVKGMPEHMAYPEEELACGYYQAKKTIKTIAEIDKESVVDALKSCQDYASPKKDAATRKNAFENGRNNLASYYEMTISLYDDFLRMIDGLWLTSAHAFVKQKGEEIGCLQDKIVSSSTSLVARVKLEGVKGLVGSEKFKTRIEQECADEVARNAKKAEYENKIKKYRVQQKAIWQSNGAVVGKRELIEQRKADWQDAQSAENNVRSAKGKLNEELLKAAASVTNEAWDKYLKDQGRYDLEQVISQAREVLRALVVDIRAIDENDLDGLEASRRGVKVLLHEAGVFNQAKYVGDLTLGNSFFTHVALGLSKHIALFKEMKPVSSEFEMRLRGVSRVYPAIGVVLPTVRLLANKYAPGIVDVWA